MIDRLLRQIGRDCFSCLCIRLEVCYSTPTSKQRRAEQHRGMSPPVSPSALFSTSPTHTPSPPLSFSSLPTFPIEVQKRILYHALAFSSAYTPNKSDSSHALGGQSARQREVKRVVERLGIHRAALTLMRVCKAWKVCLPLPTITNIIRKKLRNICIENHISHLPTSSSSHTSSLKATRNGPISTSTHTLRQVAM